MRNYTIILSLCLLLSACEEPFEWQLTGTSDLLVVEGVITNENRQHEVRLSRTYGEQNMQAPAVSGALVVITDGTDVFMLSESVDEPGLYQTDSMRAVFGKLYTLVIETNGKQYFARASQAPGQPLEPISYRKVDSLNYTLNFNESGSDPNYINYSLDWQSLGICSEYKKCQAFQVFYDLKTIDIHQQFKPDQEVVKFPAGTQVIRRKYSVSNAYKEYLRGVLSETNWRGGVFDVYPANPASNLSEGATGFFAVSTVSMDTVEIVPLP